jgi:tRNA A37 threonylcarbamoyladenosine synthetase subunit TsaC/SUA5/YrdC
MMEASKGRVLLVDDNSVNQKVGAKMLERIGFAVVTAAGIPITATSANLSGETECTSAEGVRDQLGVRIPIIVDGGASPRDIASTIVDLTDEDARWRILREGAISSQEISEFFAKG